MADEWLEDLCGHSALELWSKDNLARLYTHLHNGNAPLHWVMGFRDKASGTKTYKRTKQIPLERGISWAIASVAGRKRGAEALAFVPYSTNDRQESRWGGFDFDAHDGNAERARRFAFAAVARLRACGLALILESSGSGGWHVWVISRDFRPVADWIRLLKAIARDIGAPIESGTCEIFPPDTLNRGFGKGMRAPGSWNPGTDTLSEIHWHNADELIVSLPSCVSGKLRRIEKVDPIYSGAFPIEKQISLSLPSLSALGELIGGADCYRITKTSTRREQLKAMLGAAIHQVSRKVAELLARAQFAEKTVTTNADESEHLRNFTELWEWMEREWLAGLIEPEHEKFALLTTDAQQSGFRIVHSYARKAKLDGSPDFPIVRDNFALRLGITGPGAGQLRRYYVSLGIIEPTAPYRPNTAAARYGWTADIVQPF